MGLIRSTLGRLEGLFQSTPLMEGAVSWFVEGDPRETGRCHATVIVESRSMEYDVTGWMTDPPTHWTVSAVSFYIDRRGNEILEGEYPVAKLEDYPEVKYAIQQIQAGRMEHEA